MNRSQTSWCIWLDQTERIASFHQEMDYEQHTFTDFDQLQSYAQTLQNSGYRFQ